MLMQSLRILSNNMRENPAKQTTVKDRAGERFC